MAITDRLHRAGANTGSLPVTIEPLIARTTTRLVREWHARTERPLIGVISVPLLMTGTGLSGLWWTWPPLLGVAWVATPAWRWTWVLSFQLAVIGAEWASVGAVALASAPESRLLVGVAWAAFPLALSALGRGNRRLFRREDPIARHGNG